MRERERTSGYGPRGELDPATWLVLVSLLVVLVAGCSPSCVAYQNQVQTAPAPCSAAPSSAAPATPAKP